MVTAADLGPRLSQRLTYLLKRALLDLEELHRQHLAPLGIDVRELTVLLLVDAREPESQQQAAQRLGVDRTTMVKMLDGLEDKGLVERHADDKDRRRNVVALTHAGHRALDTAVHASDTAERLLLGQLDDGEQAHLRALLTRIAVSQPAT